MDGYTIFQRDNAKPLAEAFDEAPVADAAIGLHQRTQRVIHYLAAHGFGEIGVLAKYVVAEVGRCGHGAHSGVMNSPMQVHTRTIRGRFTLRRCRAQCRRNCLHQEGAKHGEAKECGDRRGSWRSSHRVAGA